MAKIKNDLDIQAHEEGDADGFGMFRGAFVAFGVEVTVAIIYGLLLLLSHPVASALHR